MDPFAPFTVTLDVSIRPARRGDLPTLEWFGLFAPHRQIILSTFESHERGEGIILVAEANAVPSGQIWIDLSRKALDSTGVLWAVRVFPCLQSLGIGTRLVAAAEQLLRDRGYARAELTVDLKNRRARRFYEHLGYQRIDDPAPDDTPAPPAPDHLLYRKSLQPVRVPQREDA